MTRQELDAIAEKWTEPYIWSEREFVEEAQAVIPKLIEALRTEMKKSK